MIDWEFVLTIFATGIVIAISVALIGAIIVALQMAKFNSIHKAMSSDLSVGETKLQKLIEELRRSDV